MKKYLLAVIAMLFLGLVACEDVALKGEGDVVSQIRDLNEFESVKFSIAGNVYINQEATQEVRIEAYENQIGHIETKVENGVLTISSNRNINSGKNLKIYISAGNFEKIQLSGSGNIESTGCLNTEHLELWLSGSGNIEICGTTQNLKTQLSGSGNINTYGLEAAIVQSTVSGSGNIKVSANQSLDAVISGSGNIYYKGPALVNSSVRGSGRVVNKN
jgi:hypothetical protein